MRQVGDAEVWMSAACKSKTQWLMGAELNNQPEHQHAAKLAQVMTRVDQINGDKWSFWRRTEQTMMKQRW